MKRFLSLALVLVMILSVMPMATAATGTCPKCRETCQANPVYCNEGFVGGMYYKCTACGFEGFSGGELHQADPSTEVVVPATCEEPGSRTVYCKCSQHKVMESEVIPALNHSFTIQGDKVSDATCQSPAIYEFSCANEGCTETDELEVGEKGEHNYTGATPETKPANCSEAAEVWTACQTDGCDYVKKETVSGSAPTGEHTYDANGICTTVLHNGSVCGHEREITVTASDIAINVGDTKQIKINVTGNVTSADVKVLGFTSADASIASVDSAGVVVGKKAGSTTVTVKVKVLDQEMTAVSNVTIYDGMITCADDMKSFGGNTAALTFKLTGVADDTDVKWTYSVSDKGTASELSDTTTVPSDTMTVTRKEYGTVTVKVKAEWGDSKSTDATFTISFYETVDAVLTVKDGVSKFTFGETGAFSKVKVNDKIVTATYYKMMNLLTADDCDTVILTENKTSGNAKVGKITAPSGKTAYEPLKSNEYYTTDAYGMTFTVTGEGEYVLHYSVKDVTGPAKGLTLKTGTITIVTGEAEADIVYDVAIGGTVTLDETDFTAFWKKYGTGDLSYVEFDVSYAIPYAPEFGTLYTANDQKTLVLHTYDFVPNHTSTSKDYDLDTVTYVASEKMKTAYVDTLDFIAYNKNGVSVTGTIEFNVGTKNPFTDVKESDYFYEPVLWAVEEGVTTGISETEFGPNNPCTRGQVVTFLWRAAGKPEPKSSVNPFTDVKVSDYYYKAVLWAVEKGITTGMTATTFAPNSACTRGQVVTFLHRAANTPAATGTNSFTDVAAGAYYYNAVLWAVRNGITSGMSATSFAPNTSCTRGQIVTFLYRYYAD